jgi:succinoglycan biosynthesis protein ExoO
MHGRHNKTMNPKVSVIIPAYNTEKYIRQAIYSALEQTETQIEVIVVDDASTDRTAMVVEGIPDDRVRLLKNQRNLGPSGSRNRAIEVARGEWIAILDSDDWYAPRRLERLLGVAYEHGAEMVADDLYQIVDGATFPYCTHLSLGGYRKKSIFEISAVSFLESNMPGIRCLRLGQLQPLIVRSFLERHGLRYDERVNFTEDFLFYLGCLLNGARFIVVPEPYYYRRRRAGSLTGDRSIRHLEQSQEITERLLHHDHIVHDFKLKSTLMKRLAFIRKGIVVSHIMKHIRSQEWVAVLKETLLHMTLLPFFIRRLHYALYLNYIMRMGKVEVSDLHEV